MNKSKINAMLLLTAIEGLIKQQGLGMRPPGEKVADLRKRQLKDWQQPCKKHYCFEKARRRRQMAARSNKINRQRCRDWKH
jgi:hypothetical protein